MFFENIKSSEENFPSFSFHLRKKNTNNGNSIFTYILTSFFCSAFAGEMKIAKLEMRRKRNKIVLGSWIFLPLENAKIEFHYVSFATRASLEKLCLEFKRFDVV